MRLLFVVVMLALPACKPGEKPVAQLEPPPIVLPDTIRRLDPATAKSLIDAQPRLQIIDCRMEDEFQNGHLPAAHHINFFTPEEARKRLTALDPTRPSLIYCALGTRSIQTARLMHDLGFQNIAILEGGISAWLTAGLPLTR